MITQFIATTETAVPHGVFFWRIFITAPGIGLMLAFGLIVVCSLFTWLGGGNVSEVVEKIKNAIFPVFETFGKVCFVHFILTILATLFFYEELSKYMVLTQFLETLLFLFLWFNGATEYYDRKSRESE